MNTLPAGKLRILLIEDDELARLTARNILKRIDATVSEAQNGRQGMEFFKKEKPDLVITDILMPEQEGLETIVEIRESGQACAIIAMSDGGVTQNMAFLKLAEKLGADRLLPKPFSPDELIGCIQSLGVGR